LLLTATAVLTAATGASAVTMRLHAGHPQATAAQRAALSPGLQLPVSPAPAQPAPADTSRKSAADVSPGLVRVPRPKHLVEATVLVTNRHHLSAHTRHALRHVTGVTATQSVEAGTARVDGPRARSRCGRASRGVS
jgi:hypothetical protein